MVSLGDVVKALESVPLWKQLRELPRRVAALEARLAALETGRRPDQPMCPGCQVPLNYLREQKEAGPFGDLGARERIWQCSVCQAEVVKPVKD